MERYNHHISYEEFENNKTDSIIDTTDSYNSLVDSIKKDDNKWFDEFISLCKYYYEGHPTGGCVHIVLDDGNLEDHNLEWCAGYSCGRCDNQAYDIVNLMQFMTMKQRKMVYDNYERYSK